MLTDDYIDYVLTVRRYSTRTCEIYRDSLKLFCAYIGSEEDGSEPEVDTGAEADGQVLDCLQPTVVRSYEVYLLETKNMVPRTANLHLSVLSGFCRYLVKRGMLASNPVKLVTRPKVEKRLPEFYREESMEEYFSRTQGAVDAEIYVSPEAGTTQKLYEERLRRAIVATLYGTGMRRSELVCLKVGSVDFGRKIAKVRGKGDKTREIPLVPALLKEISLYLQAVVVMVGTDRGADSPLFVTFRGKALYPEYVDKAVKTELGEISSITGKRSPHVLRHTLATELLNAGTDLNSIKELLGHSSLAATQVYTHNSIAKLKKVYESAHPRARKNGGKNGD